MTTLPTIRPYQVNALDSIVHALTAGQNRLLMQMPTGTGKTICFSALLEWPGIQAWLNEMGRRHGALMMVIAHREELLEQAADKIRKQNPGLMVAIEQADRVAPRFCDVIVASIQTLAARKFTRLKRLLQHHTSLRIVVVDEAHHAAADSYRTALAYLGFLPKADISDEENIEAATHDDVELMEAALKGWDNIAPKDRLLLGVTATPNRTDAIGLGCVFQTIAYRYTLLKAIEDGWLVPPTAWVVETSANLDNVRTTAGEFNQKDLAQAVNTEVRNDLAVAAWLEHARDLPTIAFTVDVAHAHALAEAFRNVGVRAEAVSGETPRDERRQILSDYTAGTITVITNCMVLTEGTDLPLTQCILHAKPTKSPTLYEQMTGRGLRLYPNKTQCVLIDVVDVSKRHSLQTAPVLYGLPPGLVTDGDELGKVAADLEALRQKYPNFDFDKLLEEGRFTLAALGARARQHDPMKVPDLGTFGTTSTLTWTKSGEHAYRLAYPWNEGEEILEVQRDMLGKWEVVQTIVPQKDATTGLRPAKRQRTLVTGAETAFQARDFAEAYITRERRSVTKLKSKEAPWKKNKASEKQMGYLSKLRIPFNPKTITMGEASDLIDYHKSRQRR